MACRAATAARVIAVLCAGMLSQSLQWARSAESPAPAARAASGSDWFLRLPKEEQVVFRGAASFDGAGLDSPAMLYPAPNLAGFLAALATHALILDTQRSNQGKKIQETADQVLAPYRSVLNGYTHRDLMQQALGRSPGAATGRLVESPDRGTGGLIVESLPVFAMTQDQTALILDNAVAIYAPGAASAAYRNIVRVVSPPQRRTDLVSFWTAGNGEALKAESARLLAESLELALQDMATAQKSGNPHRTVRYFEGTGERMERGQIISDGCRQVVLRNLRGWLMAVPPRPGTVPAAAACGDTPGEQRSGETANKSENP